MLIILQMNLISWIICNAYRNPSQSFLVAGKMVESINRVIVTALATWKVLIPLEDMDGLPYYIFLMYHGPVCQVQQEKHSCILFEEKP